MKVYACYDFYVQEYGRDMTEEEFNRYVKEASAYIRRITLKRSDDSCCEELKYATCAVAEAYCSFDKANPNGKIVTSEHNDGFSQSFASMGRGSIGRLRDSAAYDACRKWLANTGLLSRRIRNGNQCGYNCL